MNVFKEQMGLLEKIRNPSTKNWILMIPSSLGEVLVVCALSPAFKDRYGHGITLVVPNGSAYIPTLYEHVFDRVIELRIDKIRSFTSSGYIPPNQFTVDFPINLWPSQNGDGRSLQLFLEFERTHGKKGLNFIDLYRYNMRLDLDCEIRRPAKEPLIGERALELIRSHDLQRHKTVILNTGNNTNCPSPKKLWCEIARNYHDLGMDVVINDFNSIFKTEDLELPFAKKIDLDLECLMGLINYGGFLVSGANGAQLLAASMDVNCKIHILLPKMVCVKYSHPREFKPYKTPAYSSDKNFAELYSKTNALKDWEVDEEDASLEEQARRIVEYEFAE